MGKILDSLWRNTEEAIGADESTYIYPFAGPQEGDSVSLAHRPARVAGTWSNIRCRVSTNTVTAASSFNSYVNLLPGNQSVTITASTTGWFEDTSNTDTIAAADEFAYELESGATGTTLGIKQVSSVFDSDNDTVTLLGCSSSGSSGLSASQTWYFPVIGGRDRNDTEANREYRVGEPGTWQDASITVGTNGHDTATTIRARVNAANGNQIITVPANTGGTVREDTTNTDVLSADDDIAWQVVTGAATSGQFNVEKIGSNLVSTDDEWFSAIHGGRQRISTGPLNTYYWPIRGEMSFPESTEADAQIEAKFDFTAKEMIAKLERVAGSVSVTYRFRVNGANGNQVITGVTAVGVYTDTVNTDTIVDGDDICFEVSSLDQGNNFDTNYVGFIGKNAAAPAGPSLAGSLASMGVGY